MGISSGRARAPRKRKHQSGLPLAEKQLFAIWSECVRTQEKLRRGFSTTLGGAYTATAKSDRHPLCIEKIARKVGIWSQNRSNALISHFDQNLFCVW